MKIKLFQTIFRPHKVFNSVLIRKKVNTIGLDWDLAVIVHQQIPPLTPTSHCNFLTKFCYFGSELQFQ